MTYEEMLERIMRLDRKACVRMVEMFRQGDSRRWYVDMGRVVVSSGPRTGFASIGHGVSGLTPQEAVLNAWSSITRWSQEGRFFLRFNCPGNVPIPGKDPQVWARWNSEKDDWEDAPAVVTSTLSSEQKRSYQHQKALDRF